VGASGSPVVAAVAIGDEEHLVGGMVWTVMGLGSKILGRSVTKKVSATVWRRVTGHAPPTNPMSPTTSWGEATAWALATGALSGFAAMVATRQAAKFYRTSAGRLPPKLEKVSS
jgi:hypothetical protein